MKSKRGETGDRREKSGVKRNGESKKMGTKQKSIEERSRRAE